MAYYDWQSISDGTVVELGGSQGTMCFDLARNFPNMKCICQDLPAVVEAASVPEDLQGKVQLMPHDFFTEQPIKNCEPKSDATPEETLMRIFSAGSSMTGPTSITFRYCKTWFRHSRTVLGYSLTDLVMKACLNGKERSEAEWARLFEAGDPRFKFQGAMKVPHSRWAVMEAIWDGKTESTRILKSS
ncbi:Sterigmatocystin 8-O-methyltransferase protein [Rutstroemia sp. NJR-2017a BVV2]|nr:Sterigmatocystin 8-O-methyltransferase protein [Rutstroemia sp. NJR-2017a BVV2]PQE18630.1 Sterigmatocystin 8-O-methyltransferase protein [Rutstroemia sp. NJR-2017a BVV2]